MRRRNDGCRGGGAVVHLENPVLQRFYDLWRSKSPAGRLPGRNDIDPTEMPELLPTLVMFDVVREKSNLRFRCRLMGTDFVTVLGSDRTGKWVDESFPPGIRESVIDIFTGIVESGEPHYFSGRLHTEGREHIRFERMMCPLASDGKIVDMLIGVFQFDLPT